MLLYYDLSFKVLNLTLKPSCTDFCDFSFKRHQELRPEGTPHDVHLKNGADHRQRSFLRFRPCVLRRCVHWSESANHGTKLHPWQERGSLSEANSEVCSFPCISFSDLIPKSIFKLAKQTISCYQI